MMNVLILSGKFGMGHKMAAKAIGEEVEKLNGKVQVTELDLVSYLYPHLSRYIFKAFQMMVEHCYGIYNMVYKLSGKMKVTVKPSGVSIYKKLQKLINQYEPDVIVCTLPLCAKSIASFMEKSGETIPLITCITDISLHPEWVTKQTSAYFAPTREVKEHLIELGAAPREVYVTGIPVRQQFLQGKIEGKEYREEKKILIMGGGLGIIPDLGKMIKMLHEEPGVSATIITGSNRRAYEEWKDCYEDIEVIGYTEDVGTYMKEADLMITKAGGITLFELIHCQVPLFVIHPFLEQEVNNARYAQRRGIAKVVWDKSQDFVPVLQQFLQDESEWNTLCTNMGTIKDEIVECPVKDALRAAVKGVAA